MADGGPVQDPSLGHCNRLSSTSIGRNTSPYQYDVQGNMTAVPHLHRMQYDFNDNLVVTSKQTVTNVVRLRRRTTPTTARVVGSGK